MSPTRRANQGALFGGQQPLPGQRSAPKPRPLTNDMDLIETVIRMAGDPGYVLIGAAERVYRRRPGCGEEVEKVPGYEADAVHQLLDQKALTTGGAHQVRYGRHEGRATSVLLSRATARRAQRWANYQRPACWGTPATPGSGEVTR
jgi:hypothetical protein